jgi:hypothetical protein
VSELVHDLGVKAGFRFGASETHDLKGIPERTVVYPLDRSAVS